MEASIEEQRGVVRFLVAKGAATREIHRRMSAVYGEHCISLTIVREWQKSFREDAHYCKTIRSRDRHIELLRLM